MLHSTAFIGVHNPAVVVNIAATGKINILEVVSLLKKVLQKTPPWNMESKTSCYWSTHGTTGSEASPVKIILA